MQYADMSQAQLMAESKTRGIPAYGTKQQLIDRLTSHASDPANPSPAPDFANPNDSSAMATMQTSATVNHVEDRTPPSQVIAPEPYQKSNDATPPSKQVILPTAQDTVAFGQTTQSGLQTMEYAQRVLSKIKSKFPNLQVRIDPHQEVYVFEGGIQGRVTTTIHQPESAMLHYMHGLAPGYINAHHAGMMAKNDASNAQGDVGSQYMVGV